MEREFREKLLLLILDKTVFAFILGIVLLLGQSFVDKRLETHKSHLSIENAIANIRVQKFQELWTTINEYGESLKVILTEPVTPESTKKKKLGDANNKLYITLSQQGALLGLPKVNDIKDKLSMEPILEAILSKDSNQIKSVLVKFQEDWLSILRDIELYIQNPAANK